MSTRMSLYLRQCCVSLEIILDHRFSPTTSYLQGQNNIAVCARLKNSNIRHLWITLCVLQLSFELDWSAWHDEYNSVRHKELKELRCVIHLSTRVSLYLLPCCASLEITLEHRFSPTTSYQHKQNNIAECARLNNSNLWTQCCNSSRKFDFALVVKYSEIPKRAFQVIRSAITWTFGQI